MILISSIISQNIMRLFFSISQDIPPITSTPYPPTYGGFDRWALAGGMRLVHVGTQNPTITMYQLMLGVEPRVEGSLTESLTITLQSCMHIIHVFIINRTLHVFKIRKYIGLPILILIASFFKSTGNIHLIQVPGHHNDLWVLENYNEAQCKKCWKLRGNDTVLPSSSIGVSSLSKWKKKRDLIEYHMKTGQCQETRSLPYCVDNLWLFHSP